MTNFVTAQVPVVMKLVVGVWIFAAVLLILIVLVQKGKGGGLGAAFGGAGNSLLGTKTGDFLTWVTISLVGIWLLLSIVSAKWFRPKTSEILHSDKQPAATAPAITAEDTESAQVNTPAQAE